MTKNSGLNLNQFLEFMTPKLSALKSRDLLKMDFKAMDVDNSQCLTKENLQRVLNYDLNIGVKEEFVEVMMEIADRNLDGAVDFEEFAELMEAQ
jgi:Ca2+-binding EF-hand superfamily protein